MDARRQYRSRGPPGRVELERAHALGRDPEVFSGGGEHLEDAGHEVVGIAQIVEAAIRRHARRMRAAPPPPPPRAALRPPASPLRSARSRPARPAAWPSGRPGTPARGHRGTPGAARSRRAAAGGIRRPPPPPTGRGRRGVQDHVGPFQVAGEHQQLGQQKPGAEVGRRPCGRRRWRPSSASASLPSRNRAAGIGRWWSDIGFS